MVRRHVVTVLRNLVPVDHVPPIVDVFRSTVLVFQIVRVFPHVQSHDGVQNASGDGTLHEGIVLVGCTDNGEFVTLLVETEPDPSGSKDGTGSRLGFKFGLHLVHAPEGLGNELVQRSAGLGLLGLVGRCHFFPEKGMVVVTTTTVTNTGTGVDRGFHKVQYGHLGLAFGGLVEVGHVRGVVLVVMELHGGCVNEGFEAFERVRKVRDRVGVGSDGGANSNSSSDSGSLFEEAATRIDFGSSIVYDR
jgi:hypothetical protein